ncbi:Nuclear elongation and deformation protein 1 [Venturia nashicola]|uniref:Nuclear elongation and deformation protein 1 n=1 Tax=Venturia nashicola TaxID=86259 RepID=A0A4Z1PC24_9PEZI|nr:Nuclear elongation and deformation protein 1 [Venturia nashicola]
MPGAPQNIDFKDPGIKIPLPKPLSKHLMKELNLTDDRFPKPIPQYLRTWHTPNELGERVPAKRSYAQRCLGHKYSWVEIMCAGGLTLWWQPSKNAVRYEMPTSLQRRRARSCFEVRGYGGVVKRFHKHSRRILPAVPALESGHVTFQMFLTMLASCPKPKDIQADLADFKAIQAAGFRCGPTLSKERFRLLVYSCVDQFAPLTINSPAVRVNLLSMIFELGDARRKAAVCSSYIDRGENRDKSVLPRQHETKEVAKDTDGNDSPFTVREKHDRKSLGSERETNPDEDDFQGRILLAEAVRERYLHPGVFGKQERYIQHLWDHRDCPERWPFKISARQENAINQISRAVETWIESSATTKWVCMGLWREASEENKTRFEEAKRLVRLLFEEDCCLREGVNQEVVAYEPIVINADGGCPKDYCPRNIRPRAFGSIQDYLLSPLLARDGRPKADFVGHHVDGDVDESHDADRRLKVTETSGLPLLWSLLMKKVDEES